MQWVLFTHKKFIYLFINTCTTFIFTPISFISTFEFNVINSIQQLFLDLKQFLLTSQCWQNHYLQHDRIPMSFPFINLQKPAGGRGGGTSTPTQANLRPFRVQYYRMKRHLLWSVTVWTSNRLKKCVVDLFIVVWFCTVLIQRERFWVVSVP